MGKEKEERGLQDKEKCVLATVPSLEFLQQSRNCETQPVVLRNEQCEGEQRPPFPPTYAAAVGRTAAGQAGLDFP